MLRIDQLKDTHQGRPCIVVGTAPSALEEYAEASANLQNPVVIAVNDAAAAVNADYLATLHHEAIDQFVAKSLNRNICTICPQAPFAKVNVKHWFTGCNSGATSAWAAVKMAKAMGCSPIIMVGCPMNGGDGYIPQAEWKDTTFMRHRFGHKGGEVQVSKYQESLKADVDEGGFDMVKSMSGFTAETLGQPDWRKNNGVQ